MNIGTTELIVILALALFLYGKNLPGITRALGKGYREFRNNFDSIKNDLTKQVTDIAKDTGIKEADKIYDTSETKEDKPAGSPAERGKPSIKDSDSLAG